MFDRRLRLFVGVLGAVLVVIVLRLGQLQLVQADYYREQAERSLLRKPRQLPFVRGSIRDREGEILVRDDPCWDLTIDYRVLAADVGDDQAAFKKLVRRWKRSHRNAGASDDAEVGAALRAEYSAMWSDLASFVEDSRVASVDSLRSRARVVYDQVQGIRRAVASRRGFDAPVAEERVAHAILPGLGSSEQIAARERFARYPWVHVTPSSSRLGRGNLTAFAHMLGRLGPVDASHVAGDPNSDDPFARYQADERLGITGVEHAAEYLLRGRRGQFMVDREGNRVAGGCFEAQPGRDVTLTLHAGLQRRLYRLLGTTVERIADSSGGVIVVLDIPTREVLAMVSYPSYDPVRFDELYPALRDDTDGLALRFRAVSTSYAPGSIVKPLVCLAGLMNGTITLGSRETCTGYLFDDVRDRWRCWQIHGTSTRKAHGSINVVEALTGSCNVFMYRLGERLGVDALCSAFDLFGIGQTAGLGLREEVNGINPTPSWLMAHKNMRATPGTARLFAIGQGELSMTPVQVANLMATYASGKYRRLTLVRGGPETPEWTLPVSPEHWSAVRRGIYGVVNDPEGTAYRHARFQQDRWALCGKTGSATAHAWPTSYRVPYLDQTGEEQVATVRAGARGPAIARFAADHPEVELDRSRVEVATRWPPRPPPSGQRFSHAWFAGFLQALDASGDPDWSQEPRIAFAVVVEFGGSGGRTSGPLARAVAGELIEVFGPDLQVSGETAVRVIP